MTMPFSAAAAATPEAHATLDTHAAPDHGIYSYSTEVEFMMKTTASNAPTILSLILAKLVVDEPTIVFNNADNKRIHQSELLTDKANFNEVFSTTSFAGRLTYRFEVQSDRHSSHPIKLGVWDILQQHGVYFKKSTAPVKKILLSMMGFWVNVQPSFASSFVFRPEIIESIQKLYNDTPELLEKLNLALKFNEPDIYLERRKLNASFHDADGTTSNIATEAFVIYANVDNSARATALITCIPTLKTPSSPLSPLFIPIELKYQNPKQFGDYLAKQNNFLNQHWNIAIIRVVGLPWTTKKPVNRHLLQYQKPRRRLLMRPHPSYPRFGKMEYFMQQRKPPYIYHWIDEHLLSLWQTIPIELPEIATFPTPERLSKGGTARGSSLSVASGLTDASPVADYMKTLHITLRSLL
jgi:hypothetical protein